MTDQIDSGAKFLGRFNEIYPVEVGLWLKGSEWNRWRLYIASGSIDETNFDRGYREAWRLARSSPELNIDPDQIRVIGLNDPVARAAIDLLARYPSSRATRYRGPQFGGIGTEEVYIYPPAVVAKSP